MRDAHWSSYIAVAAQSVICGVSSPHARATERQRRGRTRAPPGNTAYLSALANLGGQGMVVAREIASSRAASMRWLRGIFISRGLLYKNIVIL